MLTGGKGHIMPAENYCVEDFGTGVFRVRINAYADSYSIMVADRASLDELRRYLRNNGYIYMKDGDDE